MNKKRIVYEDNLIKVETTGRYYDFIATIENKTDNRVYIKTFYETEIVDAFYIEPNDWVGLLADNSGYTDLDCFDNGKFEVYTK